MKSLIIVANQPTTEKMIIATLAKAVDLVEITPIDNHVWDITCASKTSLTQTIRQYCYRQKWDFALQNRDRANKKLFISDMDATIVVGETIDEMAKTLGLYEQISAITAKAMQGQISFDTALTQRLQLMKGLTKQTIMFLAEQTPITPGADNLLNALNQRGLVSCLISGGFSLFSEKVAKQLGFQYHRANLLSFDDNDCFDGHIIGDVVDATVKQAHLKQLAKDHHIDLAETVAIGDGANDIAMIKSAGLGVAFYGKPAVRAVSQAEIHSGKIDNLLWFL